MMTRRSPRCLEVGGLAVVLTWALFGSGCGPSQPEQATTATRNAEQKADGGEKGDRRDDATVVELSPEAMQRSTIRVDPVRAVPPAHVLVAPAELQSNADRIARVGPRVAGRVARVLAQLGSVVRAGQPLATIRSPVAAEAAAALQSARATENLARHTLIRERELLDKKVSAKREVLEAEAALASAEAAVHVAEARLATMGFDIATADAQNSDPVVTITSPIAGTVMERTAAVDAPVVSDSVLFTIADLSSLWLTVRVPETHAASIRRRQSVQVVVGALPDRPIEGRVDYLAPVVTPETRTVDVRLQIPNRGGELRPGMTATARFDFPDRTTANGEIRVLVPRTAVQEVNQATVVFVPVGERQFKPQPVTLGSRYGNDVEVLAGIKPGDRIVVQGAFTLKAQALRGAVADPHQE